jgi:tetratricopeptide (TPR) repeat protein
VRFFIVFLVLISSSSISEAAEPPSRENMEAVGEIVGVTGKASVRLVPRTLFESAVPRQRLVTGDLLKTSRGGRVSILFRDGTQLKMASNTSLLLKGERTSKGKSGPLGLLLHLESGEVWTRSKGIQDQFVIETPHATAAIRGTEWGISVLETGSRVTVLEGSVELANERGAIMVGRHEEGIVVGRQAPRKQVIARPKERTQWTHYISERRLLRRLRLKDDGEGERLVHEGRLEEAERVFQKTITDSPGSAAALAGLGLIAVRRGQPDNGQAWFERSLTVRKEGLPLIGTAYIYMTTQRLDEAGELLREAKRDFPWDPLVRLFASYVHALSGEYPEAVAECDEALIGMPHDPLLLAFKAEMEILLDRGEEAKETIENLVQTNPGCSEAYEIRGLFHRIITGDWKKAKEELEKSIRIDPSNDRAMGLLADLLREQGYIQDAMKLIERALRIAPWNPMHHYNRGRLLADINRIDEAKAEFRRSLEVDPSFSRAYLGEGILLLKEGKTEEALKTLLKANLFEAESAEIHNFLAIGFYQKQETKSAIDELKKASECDPLDSTPHQLASAIYGDQYMPVESIREARRVLDLLPYGKASGEALLKGAQNGTMSVNYGLNLLDLPEWSLYYAQKALFADPYRNTSHIGVAEAYLKLGEVSSIQGFNEFANPYFSELLQGQTLNVNSLNYSNQYNPLISKPGHYVTLGGTYGRNGSQETGGDLLATGDFGARMPLTYWLYSEADRASGHLSHDKNDRVDTEAVLGYKPRYDHDVFANLAYYKYRYDVTPAASNSIGAPDWNQTYKEGLYWAELGYHHAFGPLSHLLADVRYFRKHDRLENPDPEADHSGFDHMRDVVEENSFGLRHMLTLYDDHQASYGITFNRSVFDGREGWPYAPPSGIFSYDQQATDTSVVGHVYDRWALGSGITLDAGLFFSKFSTKADDRVADASSGSEKTHLHRDTSTVNPRLGLSVELGRKSVFRAGYQRRSTPCFLGELAPAGVAGLIPPTFDIQFNRAEDVQGSVEYEVTDSTFLKGLLGYEKMSDIASGERAQLIYGRVALNQILGRHFSFSIRYNYNQSKVLDASDRWIYGVPRHSGDARLVFIHPWQVFLSLRETYVGRQYADPDNRVKMGSYFVTDFLAEKEFLRKRLFLSFAVTNLLDKRYKTLNQPYWWDQQALPAAGRMFVLRGEYRFSY